MTRGFSGILLELAMGTVTVWSIPGGLALAKADGGFFGNHQLLRLKAGAFVSAVAKRAVAGLSAGAPPIGARFEF
jgi:hypothetical protein